MQPDNICNCVADIAVELPFGFLHTGDDNHDIIAGFREYIPSTTCWPAWLSPLSASRSAIECSV